MNNEIVWINKKYVRDGGINYIKKYLRNEINIDPHTRMYSRIQDIGRNCMYVRDLSCERRLEEIKNDTLKRELEISKREVEFQKKALEREKEELELRKKELELTHQQILQAQEKSMGVLSFLGGVATDIKEALLFSSSGGRNDTIDIVDAELVSGVRPLTIVGIDNVGVTSITAGPGVSIDIVGAALIDNSTNKNTYGEVVCINDIFEPIPQERGGVSAPQVNDVIPVSDDEEIAPSTQEPSSSSHTPSKPNDCKVCFDGAIEYVFMPCRHACCCGECSMVLDKCPVCREVVNEMVKIYIS